MNQSEIQTMTVLGRITEWLNEISGRKAILLSGDEKYVCIFPDDTLSLPNLGDIVQIIGQFNKQSAEKIIYVSEVNIINKCLRPHLLQAESNIRELQLLYTPERRRAITQRARVLKIIRTILNEKNFLEVETPILLKTRDIAPVDHFQTRSSTISDSYYLRICPENYLKRLLVAGFQRVFEIGKSFRDEKITRSNSPEFTTMECYQAFGNYEDMLVLTEQLISSVVYEIRGSMEIEFQGRLIDFKPPWNRIPFDHAMQEFLNVSVKDYTDLTELRKVATEAGFSIPGEFSTRQIVNLLSEKAIEPRLIQPTFLMDHPVETICVAKRHAKQPAFIERFEAFVCGVEMAHGFSELDDAVEQRARMEQLMREKVTNGHPPHELDEDFLRALEIGLPPTGGLGIGIDRLVMLVTDLPIEKVVSFLPGQ